MSHTPGLWELRGLTIYGQVNGRDEKIADARTLPCIGGNSDVHAQAASDQEQANARLIAAAPDLLAALEACMFAMGKQGANWDTGHPLRESWMQARAALAKAKGEA